MDMHLLVVAGPDKGRTFELAPGPPLQIGRSQTTATRLVDPRVSRVHCEVRLEAGQAVVVDAKGASGTFVNGQRITQQRLQPGDVIQVGDTQLRFQDGTTPEQDPEAVPTTARAKPWPSASEPLSELPGQTLAHYEVGPVLARGQSGVIYRARDTRDGRTVALKVLKPEFSQNEEDMQRFVRAMKTVLPLTHPNLVALYGAGKTGPYCWMAMECVEGENLTQWIQRIGTAGTIDWRPAQHIARSIAKALYFAHDNKIIHRNLSPHNILVRRIDGMPKLGDLMLAKALEGILARQITRPGELLGDVRYMSPERTSGTTTVDGRSDLYSLGAVVYALLTGRPPFEGGSLVELLRKVRQSDPVRPKHYQPAIPDLFEKAVLTLLAKRPEDRYQTAAELLEALEQVGQSPP